MRAIAYFCNGLGNFIMQMGAMAAAASLTETKTIDICTGDNWQDSRRQAVMDVCKMWPVVGKVLSYPTNKIIEKDYGLWFYSAHGVSCEAIFTFLRNMKHGSVPKPSWRRTLMHESDHYMDIAYAMGYQGPVPKIEFPLAAGPILDLPRPIVGLCNGWFRTEKNYWEKKGWPYFASLSKTLKNYFGGSVVGVGGKEEISSDVALDADYAGKLPILQSAKVISQLDLIVTTDTGPMHLANVLGIPLIALFGPTLVSKNGPRGKKSSVLMSGMKCAPCQDTGGFYSCKKFGCMEGITVGDVMAKAREKLK